MKKAEFLACLRQRLISLPEDEAGKSAAFYSEMIDDRIEEGMTEEEAVAALGDPSGIAEAILQESGSTAQSAKSKALWPLWIGAAIFLAAAAVLILIAVGHLTEEEWRSGWIWLGCGLIAGGLGVWIIAQIRSLREERSKQNEH